VKFAGTILLQDLHSPDVTRWLFAVEAVFGTTLSGKDQKSGALTGPWRGAPKTIEGVGFLKLLFSCRHRFLESRVMVTLGSERACSFKGTAQAGISGGGIYVIAHSFSLKLLHAF
jgi:hypothetical protein